MTGAFQFAISALENRDNINGSSRFSSNNSIKGTTATTMDAADVC